MQQNLPCACRTVDGYAMGDCMPMTTNKPYAQVLPLRQQRMRPPALLQALPNQF